jgi:hypothetical protein
MDIWGALQYVGTGLSLVAFVVAAILFAYRARLKNRAEIIKSAPDKERLEAIAASVRRQKTLRVLPRGSVPRMTRGQCGSLLLHCNGLSPSTSCRSSRRTAAQWLARTFPYRRFADILADACARLGADAVRYSFIVVDLHHLLLAGLPAHLCENSI